MFRLRPRMSAFEWSFARFLPATIVAVLLATMLRGCAPGQRHRDSRTTSVSSRQGVRPEAIPIPDSGSAGHNSAALPTSLDWEVRLPQSVVRVGETVSMQLVIRNRTDSLIVLVLAASRDWGIDFVITDVDGREVWSRAYGYDIDLRGVPLPIASSDSVVWTYEWNQRSNAGHRVDPGSYRVSGYLTPRSRGAMGTAPATVIIVP